MEKPVRKAEDGGHQPARGGGQRPMREEAVTAGVGAAKDGGRRGRAWWRTAAGAKVRSTQTWLRRV